MIEEGNVPTSPSPGSVNLLAFYLPQFYPTPYNDQWWGKGFTEWTNVVKARPRFKGHYQPHLPADLGFYDLRLPEAREAQAALAKEYGIHGFCYYHYWFNGKRILERPLDEVFASGAPDLPFCVCWANENWSRTWEGRRDTTLLNQNYSDADDLAHIHHLLPLLADPRYIRIEGKPLALIYRTELMPDPRRTGDLWRREAQTAGLGDLFLVNVESNYVIEPASPYSFGFDASVRFQPNLTGIGMVAASYILRKKIERRFGVNVANMLARIKPRKPEFRDSLYEYSDFYRKWKIAPKPSYRNFECVTPMWDNSARRAKDAYIVKNSTPALYEQWLREAVERSTADTEEKRWVFINAWNEWGEGCHLEPDQKWGHAYLEATRRVVQGAASAY